MKKLFLIVLFFIGVKGISQCSVQRMEREGDVYFTPHFGTSNTLGADLSVRINSFRIGGGASILIDNTLREQNGISYKKSEWAIYGTIGFRFDKINLGANLGTIKSEPNEFFSNGVHIQLPNTTRTLYGGYVGYFVKNNISINAGWNSLSNYNLGISFGF